MVNFPVKRSKRIAYICEFDLSVPKANVINVLEMCHALSMIGCNVVLFVPHGSYLQGLDLKTFITNIYGIDPVFNVVEIALPFRNPIGRGLLFSIQSLVSLKKNREGFEVYTRNPWVYFFSAFLFRIPVVFEAHQYRYRQKLHTFLYRLLIRFATKLGMSKGIVAISEMLKKAWQSEGILQEKICVAHDGVNIERYNTILSKAEARRLLNLKLDDKLVVYTGSMIPGKGVECFIQSASLLPEVSFLVVGGDENEARKNGHFQLQRNIHFAGRVTPNQVHIYQMAADVLCLPNAYGCPIDDVTSPVKLFEYMASNRPIVSSDMPSIREVLKHERNALLFPAGEYHALADTISLLLKRKDLAQRIATEARKNVMEYSWNKRAKKISSFAGYVASPLPGEITDNGDQRVI